MMLLPSPMPPAQDLLVAASAYAIVLIGIASGASLLLIALGSWRTVRAEMQRDDARREADRLRGLIVRGAPHLLEHETGPPPRTEPIGRHHG